ncbi:MAG: hypothetical protein QF785_00250 [Phycisphaeraceae bacterium]|nr:hypothetical protein [Phycisphaeraceae bacterium]
MPSAQSADTYEDLSPKDQNPSTASRQPDRVGHNGDDAIDCPRDPAVKRGVQWLINTQLTNGT